MVVGGGGGEGRGGEEGVGLVVADLNHCGTFALVLNKRRGPDPAWGWVRGREGGPVTQHGESSGLSQFY